MTDREVPQGNQDGVSCPFCNGTDSATGIRPQPCHSCGGTGVITAASSSSKPSDASKNASGGGSQDSIDQLNRIFDKNTFTDERGYSEGLRDDLLAEVWAWHNTQLKASIPEKKATADGKTLSRSDDFYKWAEGYNRAIDDMIANLEKL